MLLPYKRFKDIIVYRLQRTIFASDLKKDIRYMTVYGYCRCSTNETKQDITIQERELKALGVQIRIIYIEYESGVANARSKGKIVGKPALKFRIYQRRL